MFQMLNQPSAILAVSVMVGFWATFMLLRQLKNEKSDSVIAAYLCMSLVAAVCSILFLLTGLDYDGDRRHTQRLDFLANFAAVFSISFGLFFAKNAIVWAAHKVRLLLSVLNALRLRVKSRFTRTSAQTPLEEESVVQANRILELIPQLDRIDLRTKIGEIVHRFLPALHERQQRLEEKIIQVKTLGSSPSVMQSQRTLEGQSVINARDIQACHEFLNAAEAQLLAASEDGQGLEGLSDLFAELLLQIQVKCSVVGQTNRELRELETADPQGHKVVPTRGMLGGIV